MAIKIMCVVYAWYNEDIASKSYRFCDKFYCETVESANRIFNKLSNDPFYDSVSFDELGEVVFWD